VFNKGDDAFPEAITMSAFIDERWLPHLDTQDRLRKSTIKNYRQLMRDHVLPRIGDMAIRSLKPAHLQAVLDEMTHAGLAARTVAHARAAISASLQQALRWELVTVNPARATESPRKHLPELRTPTAAELRRIIDAAKKTPWEIPLLLSATTGARRGEVLGLRWKNVDLDGARASIVESLQRIDGEPHFVEPKTSRGVRRIPLLPEVVDRLRTHRAEQARRLLALGIRLGDEHVVCDRGDGEPVDPSTFGHAATRIAERAGLPRVRLHDLRHGVATALAASGIPVELTSRMLGHSDEAFTLRTYVHPGDDRWEAVSASLVRSLADDGLQSVCNGAADEATPGEELVVSPDEPSTPPGTRTRNLQIKSLML
jgi:integrase